MSNQKFHIDFVCVGAAKAGTTSLQTLLINHPNIFLPPEKELHYFNLNYEKGFDWYSSFFPPKQAEGIVVGEITPGYIWSPVSAQRMHELLGADTKLIFMLRNPMKRTFSDFLHLYRRGYIDTTSFRESLEEEVKFLKSGAVPGSVYGEYMPISKGFYGVHIETWLKYFSKSNMFFVHFEEDFIKNRAKCLQDLQEFLGLPQADLLQYDSVANKAYQPKSRLVSKIMHHPNSRLRQLVSKVVTPKMKEYIRDVLVALNTSKDSPPKLSSEDELWLYEEFFKEDIKKTSELIGRDLSSWIPG